MLWISLLVVLINFHEPLLIVPGERIGPVKLGMDKDEIATLNEGNPCPVEATFRKGRAVQLITNRGGACITPNGIQVVSSASKVFMKLGQPDEKIYDGSEDGAHYVWVRYKKLGIAFRLMIDPEGGAAVQSIAVFLGGADVSLQEVLRDVLSPDDPGARK